MNTNINPLYSLPLTKDIRGFFDPEKAREWVHTKALAAFQKKLNKVESPTYRLKVTDLSLNIPKIQPSYAEQNKASRYFREGIPEAKGFR